jgi:hypothetical protein
LNDGSAIADKHSDIGRDRIDSDGMQNIQGLGAGDKRYHPTGDVRILRPSVSLREMLLRDPELKIQDHPVIRPRCVLESIAVFRHKVACGPGGRGIAEGGYQADEASHVNFI